MLSKEDIVKQCEFMLDTLHSGCVACDSKAKEFYSSVIWYIQTLEGMEQLFLKRLSKEEEK